MSKIEVNFDSFIKKFPEFDKKVTKESLEFAYDGVGAFISTVNGEILLPEELQIRGVYLATAHIIYLRLNPSKASSANVGSATQGSVSVSYQLHSDPWKRYLSQSPYGMELLAILAQVQPAMPRRPVGTFPYYNAPFIPAK